MLICDFNPKFRRSYTIEKFIKSSNNIFSNSRNYSTGYGIDMAFFLKLLGFVDLKLFTIVGGEIGNLIKNDLEKNYINSSLINIKDDSTEEVEIKETGQNSYLKGAAPRLTQEEEENILYNFNELIKKEDVVILKRDNDLLNIKSFKSYINSSVKNNIKTIISTNSLNEVEGTTPYCIITTKSQLEDYTNLKISTLGEVLKFTDILINNGTKLFVITTENTFVIVSKDFALKISLNKLSFKVNSINLDLVAGVIGACISKNYDIFTTIKLAVSSGIFQNKKKFTDINMAKIKEIMSEIEIEEVGIKNEKF